MPKNAIFWGAGTWAAGVALVRGTGGPGTKVTGAQKHQGGQSFFRMAQRRRPGPFHACGCRAPNITFFPLIVSRSSSSSSVGSSSSLSEGSSSSSSEESSSSSSEESCSSSSQSVACARTGVKRSWYACCFALRRPTSIVSRKLRFRFKNNDFLGEFYIKEGRSKSRKGATHTTTSFVLLLRTVPPISKQDPSVNSKCLYLRQPEL